MRKFNITVNGTAYEVEVEEVKDGQPAPAPAAAPAPKAAPAAEPAAPRTSPSSLLSSPFHRNIINRKG